LALWADNNQTEFYKLYGKLIPGGSQTLAGDVQEIKVQLSVSRSPLDE